MIRQLTKTNVILGGQLEWRFVLGYNNGKLVIKDFHIAPVSSNIIFNNFSNETTLNYRHRDNIRKLYNKIKGEFFSIKTSPLLATDYPIHVSNPDSLITSTMEQQYEMGARRENVSLYGKQFSFFCPFWMDDKSDIDNGLKFVFCVTSPKVENVEGVEGVEDVSITRSDTTSLLEPNNEGTKILLTVDENNNKEIYEYIKEYIESINLNTDILNINLRGHTATISGVDCESGDLTTKNVYNIINDLSYRERPMLEQMNLIMKLFPDNHLICKQLFNFRFYFDLEDILHTPEVMNMINEPKVCSVFMKTTAGSPNAGFGEPLWDFFSNFEFLNKKRINTTVIEDCKYREDMSSIDNDEYNTNALSYLRDNECIDIIHENKINQQTCYWRILENENQIFNFYKGLNYDIYAKDALVGNNDGMFDKTPAMSTTATDPGLFTCNWVNHYVCENSVESAKLSPTDHLNSYYFINYVKKYYTSVTITPETQILWVNTIKFDLTKLTDGEKNSLLEGKEKITLYLATIYKQDPDDITPSTIKDGTKYEQDSYIIGICRNEKELNQLTLKYFLDHPEELIGSDSVILEKIKLLMKCLVRPEKVLIKRTLQYKPAQGPTPLTREFKYIKDNECLVQLYRYGGNLYPLFIKIGAEDPAGYHNFQYWVKQYNNYWALGNDYIKNLQTKQKPLFPSIGYDSLEKLTVIPYYSFEARKFDGSYFASYDLAPEYQWFQASVLKKFPPSLDITTQTTGNEEPDEKALLEKFAAAFYGQETPSEDLMDLMNYIEKYIIGLYKRTITFESKYEDGEIKNYYIIKYNLK